MSCEPENLKDYKALRYGPQQDAPNWTAKYSDGPIWAHINQQTGAFRFCFRGGRRVVEIPLQYVLRLIPRDVLKRALEDLT